MNQINKKTLIIAAAALAVGGLLSASFFAYSAAVGPETISLDNTGFWTNLFEKYLRPFVPQDKPADPQQTKSGVSAPPTQSASLYAPTVDYEQAVVKAVQEASPAVVSIIISKDVPVIEQCRYNPFGDLPQEFQQFFDERQFEFYEPCQKGTKRKETGGGSGFIISADGLILTNKHVVLDEKADYTVFTNDGRKFGAKVLARDPAQDLAVVKIAAADLPVVKLGDSNSIKLGQTAIAIGNALAEFRNTVSVGVISGLARNVTAQGAGITERIEGLIQTDAAINAGNSGGPLLNLKGEVIGINTATVSGAQNIGFAIPINQAKKDIESVKKTGEIKTPFLGARYMIINPDLAKKEKLGSEFGALVRGSSDGPGIIPNSPAEKAGLRTEDIILEIKGEKITSENPLSLIIQKYNAGDTITLKILRNGKEINLSVVLEQRPKNT